jgi:hypothetical protein
MSNFNINLEPIKIAKYYKGEPFCRVDLLIGDKGAAIIDPKPWLLSYGLVCLNRTVLGPEGVVWEQLIENSCTNDPRIVEIATKLIRGNLSERDVGTVYPPLDK